MKKIIDFGKIDLYGNGRKSYPVDVNIELQDTENGKVFSCSGKVWNTKKSDIVIGGQCLDELLTFLNDSEKFKEIYRLWKLYHKNDLHPGTEKQEKAINEGIKKNMLKSYDYDIVCEYLKRIGLYEDIYNGKPFLYGHGWTFREIPAADLEKIYKLMECKIWENKPETINGEE